MTFKVSRRADQDLIEIYVVGPTTFGREQAERYYEGLLALFGLLAELPMMARSRHEFVPPIRLRPYKAHMTAYLEEGADILIVFILHGRQDWDRYLR